MTALFLALSSQACDVCGCASSSALFPGTINRESQISLGYQLLHFSSKHLPSILQGQQGIEKISHEYFQVYSLGARYSFHPKWQGVLASLTILNACSKESATEPSQSVKSDIDIQLLQPENEAYIPYGCDTTLRIKISDALSLHEYMVEILGTDEQQYFYKEGHSHFSSITLEEDWINRAPAGMELTLKVQASNHAGEVLSKTYQFYSKP